MVACAAPSSMWPLSSQPSNQASAGRITSANTGIRVLKERMSSSGPKFDLHGKRKNVRLLVSGASTLEKARTGFPVFLPPDVEKLKEKAARDIAARIQRLPVKTSLCSEPILTGCVLPEGTQKDCPPVLLLHGFDRVNNYFSGSAELHSSCLEWRRTLPLLEKAGLRSWAVDILGWGFSDTARGISSFGVPAKREHLYEFWKAYINEPVVLVGASLGGAVALDFTLAHPNAVSKLVLVDAEGYTEGIGEKDTLPKYLAYAAAAVLKSVPLRMYANTLIFSKLSAEIVVDSMRVGRLHCLMPGWADALVDFMRSGGYDVAARIKEVQKETLIIWGEKDKILPKEYPEKFKEDIQGSVLQYIPDCGHIPHVEKPELVSNLLSAFVKEQEKLQ